MLFPYLRANLPSVLAPGGKAIRLPYLQQTVVSSIDTLNLLRLARIGVLVQSTAQMGQHNYAPGCG